MVAALAFGLAGAFAQAAVPSVAPITIRSGSSPIPSNFQQMITFNPSAFSANESSDLGNLRFYQGPTELYSWCESGCSSSSTNAVFWVKLSNGALASTNSIINMTFLPVGTEYDGVFAGEAPQLSTTLAPISVGTPISYSSASATNSNGVIGVSLSPSAPASLYICAGAIASNILDSPSNDRLGFNYGVDISDNLALLAMIGRSTGAPCSVSSFDGKSDPVAGSVIGLQTTIAPKLYTGSGTPIGNAPDAGAASFKVNTNPALVVIAISCGFSACDNSTNAVAAGSTGSITVPSGCNLQTMADYDGHETSAIYVCNSLAPGSYMAIAGNNGLHCDTSGMCGAYIAVAAYVFQNSTSSTVSVGYAKYDNGANVFSYYQNFKGASCPLDWSCIGSTVSNGIAVGPQYYSVQSVSSLNVVPVPGVADVYVQFNVSNSPSLTDQAYIYGDPTNGNGSTWVIGYPQHPVTTPTRPSFENYGNGGSYTGTTAFSPQPSSGYHIWTYVSAPTGRAAGYDYGPQLVSATPMVPSPIGLYAYNNHDISINAYWARVRIYPPNGIMPSAAVGPLGRIITPISTPIISPSSSNVYEGYPVSFTAIIPGGGKPPYYYLWKTVNSIGGISNAICSGSPTLPPVYPNTPISCVAIAPASTLPFSVFINVSDISNPAQYANSVRSALSIMPAPALSVTPILSTVNAGNSVSFNIIVQGGFGPFNVSIYNQATGLLVGNVVITIPGGANSLSFTAPANLSANATYTFMANGIDRGVQSPVNYPFRTPIANSVTVNVIASPPATSTSTSSSTTTVSTTTVSNSGSNPGSGGLPPRGSSAPIVTLLTNTSTTTTTLPSTTIAAPTTTVLTTTVAVTNSLVASSNALATVPPSGLTPTSTPSSTDNWMILLTVALVVILLLSLYLFSRRGKGPGNGKPAAADAAADEQALSP